MHARNITPLQQILIDNCNIIMHRAIRKCGLYYVRAQIGMRVISKFVFAGCVIFMKGEGGGICMRERCIGDGLFDTERCQEFQY